MNDDLQKEISYANKENKLEKILRILEVFAAVLSSVLAIVAIILSISSINNSRDLLNYQIKQERLPKVVILNNELSSSFTCDFKNQIHNYDSISTMSIPVYNIGVGLAQNCEIRWDENSIKSACIKAKDVLEHYVPIIEYDYSKDGYPSSGLYDYFFEYKDNTLTTINFYDGSTNCYEITLIEEPIRSPYILPISEQENNLYISVPKSIAVFLLEYANHNIKEPIDIKLVVSYEDITGEKFTKTHVVNFTLATKTLIEKESSFDERMFNCSYDIKVSEAE